MADVTAASAPASARVSRLAEQFVVDANGVTDALVADVTEHLGGSGCFAFVEAVSVLETFQRACLVLGVDDAPTVDDLAVVTAGGRATGEEP